MGLSLFSFSKEKRKRRIDELNSMFALLDELADPPYYVSDSVFRKIRSAALATVNQFSIRIFDFLYGRNVSRKLRAIRKLLRDHDGFRARANSIFITNELVRSRDFFNAIESKPLSDEQRRAVVVDEDNNLLIAAAGSGKTSVIVAKAGWLIRKKYRQPSELLLLAYAKDAQIEMEERVRHRLGENIAAELSVRTFHGLGMAIIGNVEGKRPTLSKVAEDSAALFDLLKSIVGQLLQSVHYSTVLITWFSSHFAQYRSVTDFANYGEYWDYIRANDIRSLRGEKLRSYEECEIANFLYLNGIRYEYERTYEHPTATADKRQYQPDFYLLDAGIYIEHFAVNARGETAPFINRVDYLRSMEWKRQLHGKHGTILIETFSHEKSKGKLTQNLEEKLARHGVKCSPRPPEDVFTILSEQGRVDPFIRLVATFLNHLKGAQLNLNEVAAKAANQSDPVRAAAFLAVFSKIFELYQKHLLDSRQIDFHDMIAKATTHAENGSYKSSFRYVLVDEFQDISLGRARLLKALLMNAKDAKLFAVGDDWQAIYRFAGSDISVMREFGEFFGATERVDMGTTFRCNDKIATVAAKFVLKNPAQIIKSVSATNIATDACVHIGIPDEQQPDVLSAALEIINDECSEEGHGATVRLLGRYRHSQPNDISKLAKDYPKLKLIFSTVHASKGLESDYVIVLGLSAGKFGFPSEIVDDPLLDMVLAKSEGYANAEERRLLYVAITRAKRRVFLLSEGKQPSSFVKEILAGGYDVTVFGHAPEADVPCPKCVEGFLEERESKRGPFFGCSNWPYCDHTQEACPHCKMGVAARVDGVWSCRQCGQSLQDCPRPTCDGWLQPKTGKHGHFLGCSNWPQCNFTGANNISYAAQNSGVDE